MKNVILDITAEKEKPVRASFGLRALAMLIDFAIEVIAFLLVMAYIFPKSQDIALILLFLPIGDVLYFVLMESSPAQATLGQVIVGTKVVSRRDSRISPVAALGRYFGKLVSWLVLGVGHLAAAWDPKNQAFHDKVANTYVVGR